MLSFTYDQWKWLYDRFVEGYTIADLADWAGIHPRTLQRNWEKYGLRYFRADVNVRSLEARKQEFLALGKHTEPMKANVKELKQRIKSAETEKELADLSDLLDELGQADMIAASDYRDLDFLIDDRLDRLVMEDKI